MNHPRDRVEVLEYFEAMEQELQLPTWIINGVYIWKLVRFAIYNDWRTGVLQIDEPHPEKQRLSKAAWRASLDLVRSAVTRNPFIHGLSRPRRVIIPHTRKRSYAGRLVDPISYSAWSGSNRADSLVLDRTSVLDPDILPEAPAYEVMSALGWLLGQSVNVVLTAVDRERINAIEAVLQRCDGSPSLRIEQRVRKRIQSFLGRKRIFRALFNQTRPEYLYIVVSYGEEPAIAAAHELGVKVVEFQHGALGRGHLGYDFKNWQTVPYFPTRMLAFGERWFTNVSIPSGCVIDPVGASAFEKAVDSASMKVVRCERLLLALSQAPVADDMLKCIAAFCNAREDWHVAVRPHPSESAEKWQYRMAMATTRGNWTVDKRGTLAEQSARASIVCGVSSTALIEAMLAGCKVAVLQSAKFGGYFESLLSEGEALSVSDGIELAARVESAPVGDPRGYFCKPIEDLVTHVESR